MKKSIKLILIVLEISLGIILLDTIAAIIFKNSPLISWKEELEDKNSWVDKGILINTYYCSKEKDIVDVSWHFKISKFTCPIDSKNIKYIDYEKVLSLRSNNADTNILVMFGDILYAKSYAIIDYAGGSKSIGIIDKLIPNKYVPKINGETNTKEILNALVFEQTDNSLVLLYNNEYVLFEKLDNGKEGQEKISSKFKLN